MTGFDIKDIPTINIGNVGINSVYVGNVLVWGGSGPTPPVHDFEQDYFTTVAQGSGNIGIEIPSEIPTSVFSSISYSTNDGSTWTTTNNVDDQAITVTVPVNNGDKVLWKGTGSKMTYSTTYHAKFSSDVNFVVQGNIMSLINGDNFYHSSFDPNVDGYIFCRLFHMNNHLTNADGLILPATTLKPYCYTGMFKYCYNLAYLPELPATTLTEGCYKDMFYDCQDITYIRELPAATLTNYCYMNMFYGCNSLEHITMLATDISATNCLENWVHGVAAEGQFTRAQSMTTLPTGDSGIPNGWRVSVVPSTLLSTITAE